MAERFARGGRLVAFGRSPAARSDARHVAVEFVHPVIVGKRALPAIGLAGEGGDLAAQVALLALPDDIAIAFGADEDGGEAARALALARARGCLTIAFSPPAPSTSSSRRATIPMSARSWSRRSTTCSGSSCTCSSSTAACSPAATRRRVHDAGASSFLYPFLDERESELEPVVDDVRRSVLMKAREIGELRAQTLTENGDALQRPPRRCARASSAAASCSRSATAARRPTRWTPSPTSARRTARGAGRPAIDLTEDPAILTAIANDIGTERDLLAAGDRLRRAPATRCSRSRRRATRAT